MSLSREEIIRMARDAGVVPSLVETTGTYFAHVETLANAAYEAGADAEREALHNTVGSPEIVEALRRGIPANAFHKFDWIESNKALANRIEAEGITPPDGMVLVPKEPVLWVSAEDLANPCFVGINAVREGHELRRKRYDTPLYAAAIRARGDK